MFLEFNFMQISVFNPGPYPGGWLIWNPCPKLLVKSWIGPENFMKIFSFHLKLINFLIQSDPPMYIRMSENFNALL
jgi:hypothetical protein